ncbi:acyl carrier protein [Amycolatopsis sp. NPDC049868]|uniref:acyl carrier protein n=1 Tax=Amycolatopsis sp. NPDC049868 TaxID=3363934 RepID=UPI0037939A5F
MTETGPRTPAPSDEQLDEALLTELLTQAAGTPDAVSTDFLDTEFENLGYDSLALLETAGLIQARWGTVLPDQVVVEIRTPRELIALVNTALNGR